MFDMVALGEAWSPLTAPERIAATVIATISISAVPMIVTAMGMMMPKAPQELPVVKETPRERRKQIAGMK